MRQRCPYEARQLGFRSAARQTVWGFVRLSPAYWMLDRRQYVITVVGFASVYAKQCNVSTARQQYTFAHKT